jgi:SAM-dependent methyltransferase
MPSRSEIERRIASFPRWHYEFDLNGHRTPAYHPEVANRHAQRRLLLLDALTGGFGGSLRGLRVLDLGCNAGYWALACIEAGAAYVLGVDGRPMHVEQSEFVFEVKGVDQGRFDFKVGDVFGFDPEPYGPFDVVLCLGLLYHVNRPVELVSRIARLEAEVVVVESALSYLPGAAFELRFESPDVAANTLADPLVLVPSPLAVVQLLRQHGYAVSILRPVFTDSTGCWDFEHGKRRMFVGVRGDRFDASASDLESLEDLVAHGRGGDAR